MVGHSSINTTMVYNRNYLSSKEQKRVMNDSVAADSSENYLTPEIQDLLEDEGV